MDRGSRRMRKVGNDFNQLLQEHITCIQYLSIRKFAVSKMGEDGEGSSRSKQVCDISKQRNEAAVRSSIDLQLIHPIGHSRFRLFPVLNLCASNTACAQEEIIIYFVIKGVLSARADVTAIKNLRMRYRESEGSQLSREIPYRREWWSPGELWSLRIPRTDREVSSRRI